MAPKPAVESFEQLTRLLLERCEAMSLTSSSPKGPASSVADRFETDRDALMPLPSHAFDAVSWHNRKADKYGRVEFGSNHYQAGGRWQRRSVLVASRWDSVTLHDPDDDTVIAVHPRAYGRAESVRDPAVVVHQLAAKPRAWGESEIRADFPDIVRRWFDERDPDDLGKPQGRQRRLPRLLVRRGRQGRGRPHRDTQARAPARPPAHTPRPPARPGTGHALRARTRPERLRPVP